ncbi:S-adenosyl-L-methionine-dependent tRNA 4-demethylwyosine synthase [Pelomyxa schiedti]|nr:S-adenosyl-L-methionine-dependent tRNA 4-demethylwyosine synthase [Pelomyxa schiedti]
MSLRVVVVVSTKTGTGRALGDKFCASGCGAFGGSVDFCLVDCADFVHTVLLHPRAPPCVASGSTTTPDCSSTFSSTSPSPSTSTSTSTPTPTSTPVETSGVSLEVPRSLSSDASRGDFYVFMISTVGAGQPPDSGRALFSFLSQQVEGANSSCASTSLQSGCDQPTVSSSATTAPSVLQRHKVLQHLQYCVFAIGNSTYPPAQFCAAGRKLDHMLFTLGGQRIYRLGIGDTAKDVDSAFISWLKPVLISLTKSCEALLQNNSQDEVTATEVSDDEEQGTTESSGTHDIEDSASPNVMITPSQKRVLTKEGYTVIGTHSAGKQCRWTKNALRGRGLCYKYTFYGIKSHQCMEFTPALACANKCIFCWRHHNNPVGTEWIWKVDDPAMLVEQGIQAHRDMVKPLKGVPDIVMSRYEEAFNVRHCALSLVGEPIMYPRINEFISILHSKGISTFMVTNAQMPDALQALQPVTQLYLSIDAARRETLQAIDQPLFPDFWERYLACIDIVANKKQRTVFRLTVVKEWNMDPPADYAALVKRGKPHFVEIKGATYCGGKYNPLSLANIPWHDEVLAFAKQIETELGGEYELVSEHMHSCCVLLAHKSLKRMPSCVWRTHLITPTSQRQTTQLPCRNGQNSTQPLEHVVSPH